MKRWMLIRGLEGPAFLILVGITLFLHQCGILSLRRSWPLYLILAGVLQLVKRAALAGDPAPFYDSWHAEAPPSLNVSPEGEGRGEKERA